MKKLSSIILAALLASGARAEVQLPAVIGNHMVLQQNTEVNLWGKAQANAKVTIRPSWTKTKYTATADGEGRWKTTIATTSAGGPYTLTFSDGSKTKTELTDILLGEVWVCSGQSNMEMPLRGYPNQPVEGSAEAIAAAGDNTGMRFFTVPRKSTNEPQYDCESEWKQCSPMTARSFSAMGYFFGLELYRLLKIPVGLIESDYGGTPIESWMSRQALDATKRQHPEAEQGMKGFQAPCGLYNAMICPVKGFTAKGFIWYQGEANRGNWYDYAELQKALIALWRQDWGNSEMPFYITQIAPYLYNGAEKRLSALFVDQQYKAAAETPHCEVISTQDVGEGYIIHPAKKQVVANRMAWTAATCDYGIAGLPVNKPRFKSMEQKDGKLVLHFTFGLNDYYRGGAEAEAASRQEYFVPRNPVKGFEIAGEDRKFYPATGNHILWGKNTIELWSEQVPHPVAVRYAYRNFPEETNVVTQLGLPLPSFRTDDWEMDDL